MNKRALNMVAAGVHACGLGVFVFAYSVHPDPWWIGCAGWSVFWGARASRELMRRK